MRRVLPALTLACSIGVSALLAQAPVERLDYATIALIRDEGLNRSQVMDHIGWLSDVYGPRLTGSPAILQASDWAMRKFDEWGLTNAHRETWPFGKGWSLVRFSAHMIEPQIQPLIGFPGSWTPGTHGTITADVVQVVVNSEADFEKYRGKLAGKIVLSQPERDVPMLEGLIVHRMGPTDFAEAATTPIPAGRGVAAAAGRGGGQPLATRIAQFIKSEGVVATLNRGSDIIKSSVGSNLTTEQQPAP